MDEVKEEDPCDCWDDWHDDGGVPLTLPKPEEIYRATWNNPLCKNCGGFYGNVYFGMSHWCEKGYEPGNINPNEGIKCPY